MFWVDEITNSIIARNEKDSYLINDSTTPSGSSHVGALRGLMIHDLIRDGLTKKDKKAKFIFGFDDFDPMDGLPVYVDQSFKKYMGLPLTAIPAPDGKHTSFADQYASELKEVIKYLKIEPEFYYTTQLYKEGKFNDSIKTILDQADKVRLAYKEISGSDKGEDWYPLQVVCPNCGKIGTTRVNAWDGKVVEFECMEDMVDWAQGCGHKGKISPFDGNAKLPYKAEWPSKWNFMNIDIEGAGKDHSSSGGTREVANRIYKEVFEKNSPYDIPYEFFLIGGKKMKSSAGSGATAKDMASLLPTNILRFLMVRTKAKRAIEFDPEGDTIPLLYDEYDRCAQEYLKNSDSDLKQAFIFTEVDVQKDIPSYVLRFSKISNFLQMPRVDIIKYAEDEKDSALNDTEKQEIENRIDVAKKWLENYAPDSVKFTVQETLPDLAKNLNDGQKEFLNKIADAMSAQEKYTGEDLHSKIHDIKNEMAIAPKDAFSAIYLSFIGKDSGPQAGWLLASLDKDFVIKRLKEV